MNIKYLEKITTSNSTFALDLEQFYNDNSIEFAVVFPPLLWLCNLSTVFKKRYRQNGRFLIQKNKYWAIDINNPLHPLNKYLECKIIINQKVRNQLIKKQRLTKDFLLPNPVSILLTHLRQKFTRSKKFYAGRIFLFLLAYIFLIFIDLHYLGNKNKWNFFDKIRIKTYLKSGILVGYLTPPIGPLKAIHYSSILGNAFLNKELPEIENMDFTRQILMRTEGNPSKRRKLGLKYSDSFATKLRQHENQAMLQFYKSGKTSYTKEYAQTLKFSSYGIPMYDIWMVYVTTNIVNRIPKTAYLVWGMGVATDKNSEVFFGGQMGLLQHIVPLKWFNKLESQGVAKGYWSLMAEDNETSEFSYTKRFLQPSVRKSIWLKQTYLRHQKGLGKNANEIISLSE